LSRVPREGGDPGATFTDRARSLWTPAFAGDADLKVRFYKARPYRLQPPFPTP